MEKYKKHNGPTETRKFGVSQRKCQVCGRIGGHIRKYGLSFCRQCFRDKAQKLGFKKYN